MGVRRELLINKLRSVGYEFKKQGDRVETYKRKGTTEYATIRRRDIIDEPEVRSTLKMAGFAQEDIDMFIGECCDKKLH